MPRVRRLRLSVRDSIFNDFAVNRSPEKTHFPGELKHVAREITTMRLNSGDENLKLSLQYPQINGL
jgi:hypothetical protein